MKIVEQSIELLWCTPSPEGVIVGAGRTCYKSEQHSSPEEEQAFIRRLIKSGHESVIEHAVASFRIVCDRGISHEIVRHRLASYSQESTRYCNYGADKFENEISVIEPPGLSAHSSYGAWSLSVRQAEQAYLDLTAAGVKPQIARSVLPTCLKTELVMTCNFREWRHFIKLRTSPKAHPQIRVLARRIRATLNLLAPSCFEDLAAWENGE